MLRERQAKATIRCFRPPTSRLSANVENLILQGSADLQGYGNSQSNVIYGNSGNNLIDGGGGVDLMVGGAGNDIYFVDDISDAAVERPRRGQRCGVCECADYGLAADVETLVLQGSADLQGYGNNQANAIYGNAGNNLINGGGGVDLMVGGAGNDTYFVDNAERRRAFENLPTRATTRCSRSVTTRWPRTSRRSCFRAPAISMVTGNALANGMFGNAGRQHGWTAAQAPTSLPATPATTPSCSTTGQASGDVVVDFVGNGAAAGDLFQFIGFGTAAEGATFTQIGASNQWQIYSGLDAHNETITLSNGATVHASDFLFG